MAFIEAPTNFYLGRTYDPEADRLGDDVVYYDSRDLTTHAVVVGMTGSGKTGLCISILEEAVLDNIPAIIIDPKGDITNLLLTFPNLTPEEFMPWIQPDDARRAGMDIQTYAADVAERWRSGLLKWGIVPERVTWMKHAAQFSIYTPGSEAGLPISILASLKAPESWEGHEEVIREKINAVTTALLALTGLSVEPVKDREHVLVANIFEFNWRQGRDLTLEDIILQVQRPPFEKLGVFPIDEYISERNRQKIAMELNNIVAAPSFQSWIQGEAMDIQRLLYQPNGRPKVSIFYTAHLNDAERMFITTLLLESVIGWMRSQRGTTSLKALLYIDEIFGYFPPYPKNPPTKEPMLRLLKQARAFGIGLVLATQNPGDLDYKGLANAGTWFIGRLQSDNDRRKVMDGLISMASAEEDMNIRDVEAMIASIKPRVFLMRNVHNTGGPLMLHTRWCMSYLSGPLTRQQVQQLMARQRQELMARLAQQQGQAHMPQPMQQHWQQQGGPPPPPPAPPGFAAPPAPPPTLPGQPMPPANMGQGGMGAHGLPLPPPPPGFEQTPTGGLPPAAAVSGPVPSGFSANQPPISSTVPQYFLPTTLTGQQSAMLWQQETGRPVPSNGMFQLVYQPVLFAQATVRFQDRKAQIYTSREYAFHVYEVPRAGFINWEQHQAPALDRSQIAGQPFGPAWFGDLSPGLADRTRVNALKNELTDMLYATVRLVVPYHPHFKVYGSPDGEASVFQSDVYQRAREERDKEVDALSDRYGAMMDRLEDRMRKKERELEAEKLEIRDRKREHLYTTGEAVLSIFKGRTNYTLSRMSRATRYKRQTEADIRESHEVIGQIEQEMYALEQDYEQKLEAIDNKWLRIIEDIQEYLVTPFKKDINMDFYGIGWVPAYYVNMGGGQAALLPAFR